MDIKATRTEDVVVLTAVGMIDTRGAMHFEREVSSHVAEGIRRFVIDLARVELITSAGIRVLVMLAKRVAQGGGLVLCGLNEHVTAVFEVSGLLQHFPSAATAAEGIARLREVAHAPAGAHKSKVSRAAMRLLGPEDGPADSADGPAPASASRLTEAVARLLQTRAGLASDPPSPAASGSPAR